jgi:hypothetical protein
MTNEEAFNVDRGERAKYESAALTDEILLPLTKDGFNCLIELVAKQYGLPVELFDDSVRSVFCGYVHHIDRECNSTTLEKLGRVLTKSVANAMSWTIDQEIKDKARKVAIEKQAKQQEAARAENEKAAKEKAEQKRAMKSGKKVTFKNKSNEKAN